MKYGKRKRYGKRKKFSRSKKKTGFRLVKRGGIRL